MFDDHKKYMNDPLGLQSDITMVIGASLKPWRYSHKAVVALNRHGHRVIAIGLREGFIEDIPVVKELPLDADVDTVTMYIGAPRQSEYADYLVSIKPRRVIFNPGAENSELAEKLAENGVEVLEACTLVMLATGQY